MLNPRWLLVIVLVFVVSLLTWGPAPAAAQTPEAICTPPLNPVVLDNPTVVTTCTEAGLQTALSNGGQITFDCGPDPITITVSAPLQTSATEDIVLDGQGLVTLDGGDTTRILEKPFTPGSEADKTLGNDLTLQNLRFVNGRAPTATENRDGNARGGAIWVTSPGTRLHIINTTFKDNQTTSITDEDNQGGAVYAANIFETVIVSSTFVNNEAGSGGGFGAIASGLIVYNSYFANNRAADDTSGGIVRGHGGAIHLDGVTNSFNPDSNKIVDICGTVFADNTAVRGGGAIKVTVSDNKGTRATYDRSTFVNNRLVSIPPTEGSGGAIYHIEDDAAGGTAEDNIEIRDSLFAHNYAYRQGGGVWILVRGEGRIVNSTFYQNAASETGTDGDDRVGQGGGVIISLGFIDIINSTFVENFASFQGGAIFAGGTNPDKEVTLFNSLFYFNDLDENFVLNPGEPDPITPEFQGYHTNRPLENGGGNLQFPRTKEPDFNNDINNLITTPDTAIIFTNPEPGPLADNGGPNETVALLPGSSALDAAVAENCPAADQRGIARPQGGGCDIGAYEAEAEVQFFKVAAPAEGVSPGATVAFTLTVVNNASAVVNGVALTDTLPAGLQYVTGSIARTPAGAVSDPPGVIANESLAIGELLQVTYQAVVTTVGTGEQTFENVAQFSATGVASQTRRAAVTVQFPTPEPEFDEVLYLPLLLKSD